MATTATAERKTYTVDEVAAMLGIGRASLYSAIKKGEIPGAIRLGKRIVLSKVTIDAMLTGRSTDSHS